MNTTQTNNRRNLCSLMHAGVQPVKIVAHLAALCWSLLLSSLALANTESNKEPVITLRLAHFIPVTHPMHEHVMQPWAKQVEQLSGGQLRIRIYPAGELGADPPGQLARVESGTVDIVWGLPGYTPDRFPLTLLSSLPGYFDNALQATDGLQRLLDKGVDKEYTQVRLLALWANEPAVIFTRQMPVVRPADLQARILRHPTTVGEETVRAWGASNARSLIELAAASLREGSIDAAVMDPGAAVVFNVHTAAYWALNDVPSFTGTFFLLMNRQRWDSLPEDLKAVLNKTSGRALACQAARAYRDQGIAAMRSVLSAGVKIITPDISSRDEFTKIARLVSASAVQKFARQSVNVLPKLQAMEQASARNCEP